MKLNKKVFAVALASVIVVPSISHASDAEYNRIMNQLNKGMNEIGNITGVKVENPVTYVEGNSTTTTTTTTSVVSSNNQEKKETKKDNAQTVANLKAAIEKNAAKAKYAEKMLNDYPRTVKGLEEDLVKIISDSHQLRLQAAATINKLTGEKITVESPNVPSQYLHLVRY